MSLHDNERDGVYYDFDNLQALAAALRRVVAVHGQAVRLSDNEAYLSLLRPMRSLTRITCICCAAYRSSCQQYGVSSVLHLLVLVYDAMLDAAESVITALEQLRMLRAPKAIMDYVL